MRISDFSITLLVVAILATNTTTTALAKPNSYPGENSKFKSVDPAAIAQQKVEREKRIELRKQKREERRRERQNRRNNRSN
jgi:hypothetical protein